MMSKWRGRVLALVLWAGMPIAALAQNAIQSINSSQQGASEVVRIELSEPLAAVPNGFAIQTPPRIAIDLPGVTNALGRSVLDINQGNLRSVNVAQAGDRTRLVLNLKQATNYQAQIQGKALLLVLDSTAPTQASSAGNTAAGTVRFAESLNNQQLALKDIDFRRGADNTGRIVVELPNNQVGVDIRQQGQGLVVEFLRSTLPDKLRRRLDVTDFGTPVQTITTSQQGDRVRMIIDPRGAWEHSAYQSDNQFVLEVRPQKVDPNKLTQGPGYAGEKLSLNFQNIEVRALLQVIADFTNFNVVTSDTVTGNVTLRLKDVPWDQALDIILQAKGLGLRKSGNVIWIAPKDELAAKEKADLEAKQQITALEPLRTQAFQLNYAKVEDIAKGLTGQTTGQGGSGQGTVNSRILSPRGSVIYETRTNQMFISDIPSKLEEIQGMLAKIDIPVRQVLIEARIVIADDKFGQSLGVKLGGQTRGNNRSFGSTIDSVTPGAGTTTTATTPTPISTSTTTSSAASPFVVLPAIGQGGYDPSTFALSLFNSAMTRFLSLEISAAEADGKGKVVSSPRVITADQQKALIEQGTELPYQAATSSGATSVQFRKANLKLEVTPQITPEGNVILDVDITKDSPGQATPSGFAIDTKHVQTKILVDNGGTVMIGGIFEQTDSESISKVPLLGDIPILGNLFKTRTRSSEKTEMLIFLTPKVVSERTAVR